MAKPTLTQLLNRIDGRIIKLEQKDRGRILGGQSNLLFKIGKSYYDAQIYNEAFEWFRRAFISHSVEAPIFIGHLNFYGLGREENYSEALKWYKMNAEDPLAQYHIGAIYEEGRDAVPLNLETARRWYEKSALGKNVEAQYKAGVIYSYELYDPKCKKMALKYLNMAALEQHQRAIRALKALEMLLGEEEVKQSLALLPQQLLESPEIDVVSNKSRLTKAKAKAEAKIEIRQRLEQRFNTDLKGLSQSERKEMVKLEFRYQKHKKSIQELKAELAPVEENANRLLGLRREYDLLCNKISGMETLLKDIAGQNQG